MKKLGIERTVDIEIQKINNKILFIEERMRDLRDDIDYLFRSYGKIEEAFLEDED